MPMIEVTTTERLTKLACEEIKSSLGKNITIFPGKDESRVMVVLKGDTQIYFGGQEGPACLVSVALFKPQPSETYDTYSKLIVDTIVKAIPTIEKSRIYVKYQTLEFKAWGKEL